MTLTRRARLMKLAIARADRLSQSTLAPNKPWVPLVDYRIFSGIKRPAVA